MANSGQSAKEKGRRSERQRYLDLVAEAEPQRRAYVHAGLGDLAISEGEPEEAVRQLRQALELGPLEPHFHYLLGFAYGQMERWREAEASLRKAVELQPGSAEYRRCLGWVLCNSKQVERGRRLLLEARKIEPRNPHILSDLSASCLDTGELGLARRYAAEARSLAPDDPLIHSLVMVTEQVAPEADW
ncbi:MAG: hypothetical protein A2Z17_04585 [Gammaproteobacteria bacterium RBG_16_66_13]|nr:MAG: hypothetical protein A2Z17_04585 [Gammaproteobacteria bacterium RBG_16_66_13]